MDNCNAIQHFILTRFNLLLWNRDKEGHKVRTTKWLEHRFQLFEKYCLPSIANQTCKNFNWIALFDNSTPERYKERIVDLQSKCSQLIPVFVEPENGRYFAEIFRKEVVKRLYLNDNLNKGGRVLTTYLDNDDAMNVRFVEDLQKRVGSLHDRTYIYYTDGYQFFTDYQYLMRIHYSRNHFVSVVESANPEIVKTIYGYGSHYYIDKIEGAKIEYVKDVPMWCQVVHEKNMGNDAYFIGAKMVNQESLLITDFGIQEEVKHGVWMYLFRFLPRYAKTFIRRCKIKLRGYRFE